ncbi:putative capsular polysaccharide biosynthesis protein YwqC [Paenibacillus sp. J31TS4]|uniref:YveK family protein n=1 Tax=Paenibacillus sp. J31TS4 TaxID=2807195 RepID=UPI001B23EA28|nr:Wzz/FepE/Etk N-terminal domain-containing protein [Paenibacillus sp. J31TS4]GIP39970.1 putative capsular polysaccharide biosynthesis protein YwqC [Paenibacillus sp. J31TS4]
MELDLKDYLRIIQKRIWLILCIVVFACVSTGVISYFFIQPVYSASTKLIVNKSNERVGIDQIDINSINTNLRLIDTYKEIIKTPAIMDVVVRDFPQFALTAEELIEKVKVSSVNNTQVMTLQVQDRSYDKAVQMVNAVSKVFQKEISTIMKVDNVSLLNEAKPMAHPVPVKPNPMLNIAISFVVSLMAALGLAFLLEYLDDTIKSEADVEAYLGLPTLSLISKMKEEDLAVQKSTRQNQQVGESKHATIN